jgi:hypothetical protein
VRVQWASSCCHYLHEWLMRVVYCLGSRLDVSGILGQPGTLKMGRSRMRRALIEILELDNGCIVRTSYYTYSLPPKCAAPRHHVAKSLLQLHSEPCIPPFVCPPTSWHEDTCQLARAWRVSGCLPRAWYVSARFASCASSRLARGVAVMRRAHSLTLRLHQRHPSTSRHKHCTVRYWSESAHRA